MAETLLRVLLVGAVLLVAGGVAYLSRRKAYHAPIDATVAGFSPGLVVFTSTECRRCKIALAAAKATGAPLREVTYELEASLQERLGVTGVPLTLVIDREGRVSSQFAGLVRSSRLQRALSRAGV